MGTTHVLITRPEPDGQELAERLKAAGLVPVVVPPYRFESVSTDDLCALAWPPAGRHLAIFTSTRAVRFGLEQLDAELLREAEVAAIGPATAEALSAAGIFVSLVPEGRFTSEALLESPDLARAPGSALIFTAPGGREALQEGLERLGWSVRMAHVYRRVDQAPSAAAIALLDGAEALVSVWTSENAMSQLAGQLPAMTWRAVCGGVAVTISERLAVSLKRLGVAEVRVADGPGNEALAAAVLDLISTS